MTDMPDTEIDWREESRRFDGVADRYDVFRPTYPEELIDALISMTGVDVKSKILEIGSGTGKATLLLARRGLAVHCIEPGQNLVLVAAQALKSYPRVNFETIAFEQWHERMGEFDLAVSAQAFHWIPQPIGYAKVARALKASGYLALFWNMYPDLTDVIFLDLRKVYEEHVPDWADQPNSCEELIKQRKADIEESGLFRNICVKKFPWSARYNAQEYVGLLGTYSDHLRLSEERRKSLFEDVSAVIARHGGIVERPYLAVLYVAQAQHHLVGESAAS